jgi:hypothetical protein
MAVLKWSLYFNFLHSLYIFLISLFVIYDNLCRLEHYHVQLVIRYNQAMIT